MVQSTQFSNAALPPLLPITMSIFGNGPNTTSAVPQTVPHYGVSIMIYISLLCRPLCVCVCAFLLMHVGCGLRSAQWQVPPHV